MTFEELAAFNRVRRLRITKACARARLERLRDLATGHEFEDWNALQKRLADAAHRAGLDYRLDDSTDIDIVDVAWRLAFEEAFGPRKEAET